MGLENDFDATLSIEGEDYGGWDQHAGGAYDMTEQKYTPYDGVERTFVAKKTQGNITLSRDYRPSRDGQIVKNRETLQGSGCLVTLLDRDSDGNLQHNRPPAAGLIKAITPPDTDSDGSNVAKITIEVSVGTVLSS